MAIRIPRLEGLLATLIGVAAFTSGTPVHALPVTFTVSPVDSRITVSPTSIVTLDLGPQFSKPSFQIRGGTGVAAPLPGGGLSDGLTTSLSGSVATDLATGASLRIVGRATEIALGTSGQWSPAAPGAASQLESADLGVRFRFAGVDAALRDVTLSLSTPAASALVSAGPGVFTLAQDIDVALTSAVLDFLDPGFAGRGRVVLHDLHALLTSNATLLQTGPDTLELRIPLDASLHVPAAALHGVGFITSIDLDLTGQLVARATLPIPEPGTLLLVATGLALVALRRRPAVARAARHPLAWAVILVWPELVGCGQFPAPLIDASDPDEEIVVEEMGTEGTDAVLQWGPLTVTGTAAPAFPGTVTPILFVDAGALGFAAATVQSFGHFGNADAGIDINWLPTSTTSTARIHLDSLQTLQFSVGSVPSITMEVTAESSSKVVGAPGVRGTPDGQVAAIVLLDCFDLADPAQPIVTQQISTQQNSIGSPVPIVVPIFAPAGATATARCVFNVAVDSAPGLLNMPVKQSVSLLVSKLISGDVARACRTANDCFVNEACGIDDVCRPVTEGSACQYADHCASPFPSAVRTRSIPSATDNVRTATRAIRALRPRLQFRGADARRARASRR